MKWFWLIWGFDACCSLVALILFGSGLRTATNPGSYFSTWLPLLCVAAVILTGSLWLKNAGHLSRAILLLCTGALPWLLWGGLILLLVLSGKNKWN